MHQNTCDSRLSVQKTFGASPEANRRACLDTFCPGNILDIKENELRFYCGIYVRREADGSLNFTGPNREQSTPVYLDHLGLCNWFAIKATSALGHVLRLGPRWSHKKPGPAGWLSCMEASDIFVQHSGRTLYAWSVEAANAVMERMVIPEVKDRIAALETYRCVRLEVYNQVVGKLDLLKQLEQENPMLFPLVFAALGEKKITLRQDSVAQLKKRMARMGHALAAWRTLVKMQDFFQLATGDLRNEIPTWRLVNLAFAMAGALQCSTGMPSMNLMRRWIHALLQQFDDRKQHLPPAWFRSAAIKAEQQKPEDADFEREYEEALAWLNAVHPQPDKQQRHAGWPWIMRQSAQWAYESWKDSLRHEREWGTSVELYCDVESHLLVQPLTSKVDLLDEGDAMDHCVGRFAYDDACREGNTRLFSIRRGYSRVATTELRAHARYDHYWELWVVLGRFNQDVSDEIRGAAERLSVIYSACAVPADHVRIEIQDPQHPDREVG